MSKTLNSSEKINSTETKLILKKKGFSVSWISWVHFKSLKKSFAIEWCVEWA